MLQRYVRLVIFCHHQLGHWQTGGLMVFFKLRVLETIICTQFISKICLLTLPSSCYTSPCYLVTSTLLLVHHSNFYLTSVKASMINLSVIAMYEKAFITLPRLCCIKSVSAIQARKFVIWELKRYDFVVGWCDYISERSDRSSERNDQGTKWPRNEVTAQTKVMENGGKFHQKVLFHCRKIPRYIHWMKNPSLHTLFLKFVFDHYTESSFAQIFLFLIFLFWFPRVPLLKATKLKISIVLNA